MLVIPSLLLPPVPPLSVVCCPEAGAWVVPVPVPCYNVTVGVGIITFAIVRLSLCI